ncbi:MAG: tRNA pseudouridine(55) synthase TruB [Propionibacteriaceae bacterium]|jgi:tRNA pseudouridine55 synthase|nr:tRNA pseudouridine(55) synthase TruB [Propionibacteriaceae bacterium]
MTSESGVLVLDKPAGLTSHQVVARVRRLLGTKKVGHAGTLDPMATGVLLVGVNRATRLLGFLSGEDKSYQATVRLGQTTATDDADGEIVLSPGAAGVLPADVEHALTRLRGEVWQVPSAVSAIKVDGKRAYARVRAGEDVQLKARQVAISRLEATAFRQESVLVVGAGRGVAAPVSGADGPPGGVAWRAEPEGAMAGPESGLAAVLDVDIEVDCSSGTYVRAIARDLGQALGVGGHLTRLRRTRVGRFAVAEADRPDGEPRLLPMGEVAARVFPIVEATAGEAADIAHGRALERIVPADPTALLRDGELLALYRPGRDKSVAVAVFV